MENLFDESLEVETVAEVAEPKATNKKNPFEKFEKLSKENQEKVTSLVDGLATEIGGENPELELLLPILEKLNAMKKVAREIAKKNEKKQKEDAAALAEMNGFKVLHHLKEGDEITFLAKSAGVYVIETVTKLTEKRVRVEVDESTRLIRVSDGTEIDNETLSVKTGVKSVMPKAITEVNGVSVEDFLASFEG